MSVWFCRPALPNWKIEVNIGTGEKNQSGFVTPAKELYGGYDEHK